MNTEQSANAFSFAQKDLKAESPANEIPDCGQSMAPRSVLCKGSTPLCHPWSTLCRGCGSYPSPGYSMKVMPGQQLTTGQVFLHFILHGSAAFNKCRPCDPAVAGGCQSLCSTPALPPLLSASFTLHFCHQRGGINLAPQRERETHGHRAGTWDAADGMPAMAEESIA